MILCRICDNRPSNHDNTERAREDEEEEGGGVFSPYHAYCGVVVVVVGKQRNQSDPIVLGVLGTPMDNFPGVNSPCHGSLGNDRETTKASRKFCHAPVKYGVSLPCSLAPLFCCRSRAKRTTATTTDDCTQIGRGKSGTAR
jgi:hypothetical protein